MNPRAAYFWKIPVSLLTTLLLTVGFFNALGLRTAAGGVSVEQSPTAGLVFAGCLVVLSLAVGLKTKFSARIVLIGIWGGVLLCLPALLAHSPNVRPFGNYLSWAAVVSIVALAEEAFLRGVLYESIQRQAGQSWAIVISAVAFAILHLPLYGWHSVPLNFAVGIWLGGLRAISGSWLAPGVAHMLADLAGWWL